MVAFMFVVLLTGVRLVHGTGKERSRIREGVTHALRVLLPEASRAAHLQDGTLARQVVDRALAFDAVDGIRIWDDFGHLMAEGSRIAGQAGSGVSAGRVGGEVRVVALSVEGGDVRVGRMEVRPAATRVFDLLEDEVPLLLVLGLQSLLLVAVFGILMERSVFRPVRNLVAAIRNETLFPEHEPVGKADGLLAALRHAVITALSRSEAAVDGMRQGRNRYRAVFENAPVGLFVQDFSDVRFEIEKIRESGLRDFELELERNPDMVAALARKVRVVDANPAAERLYRAPERDVLVTRVTDTFSDASLSAFREQLAAIWHGRTACRMRSEIRDFTGRLRHVEITWIVAAGSESSHAQVLVSMEDATARVEKRTLFEQFRKAMDVTEEKIAITDERGVVEYVNPSFEQHTGYGKAECIGRPHDALGFSRIPPGVRGKMRRAMDRGVEWQGEIAGERKDGGKMEEKVRLVPVRGDADLTGFVVIRRQHAPLVAPGAPPEREGRGESGHGLSGAMAHDFNNLLSPIIGYTELALSGDGLAVDVQDSLHEVLRAGKAARGLVRRLQAPQGKPLPIPVPAGEEEPEEASGFRPENARILLVDDDPTIVQLMARILEDAGYRVATCTDGKKALSRFRADPFSWDLVVTDMNMPGMSGTVLVREIREVRKTVGILLCTGSGDGMEAVGIPGVRLLAKPITRGELKRAVREELENTQAVAT